MAARLVNVSADVFSDASGKKWTVIIREHPAEGGEGLIVWQREGMRTQSNAEMAMESAYQRLKKARTLGRAG